MTHAKDRSHRMLCNGCSPFDSSATSTFVHLWTLCPSCSASNDARELPSRLTRRTSSRFDLHAGAAAVAALVGNILIA